MTKPYRFLVKNSDSNSLVFEVYKVTSDNTDGTFVASFVDKDCLQLFLQLPAITQMLELEKRNGNQTITFRPRQYGKRTLSDFTNAFVGFLRKL